MNFQTFSHILIACVVRANTHVRTAPQTFTYAINEKNFFASHFVYDKQAQNVEREKKNRRWRWKKILSRTLHLADCIQRMHNIATEEDAKRQFSSYFLSLHSTCVYLCAYFWCVRLLTMSYNNKRYEKTTTANRALDVKLSSLRHSRAHIDGILKSDYNFKANILCPFVDKVKCVRLTSQQK